MVNGKVVSHVDKYLADSRAVPRIEGEMVNHPSHYNFGRFEVLDVLIDWFPNDPLLWQVCKYIARANHKNNKLEDLKKAQFYLDRQIKELEKGT